MLKAAYYLLICIFYCPVAVAQFSDSTHYYLNASSSGNLNNTNTGHSYLLNNGLRFSIKKKKISLNASESWLYGKQDSNLTNNDFSSYLDFDFYPRSPKFYYWGLANYTTSYSLKINNQFQTGLGIAYNFIDRENLRLNLSDGILYESSDLYINGEERDIYHTFRNSLRLVFKWSIKEVLVFEGTGFLQNSLQYKNDYIIRANSSVSFKLNKWLSVGTTATYNRFERTTRENLLLSYGLILEKYF
ncbi:DUF481 domain-containing protein [Rubrolithibacter danxiaensis]|uniref:DUF481 domain-containing protein n=1 Tax=Rubrolithibacter danxiaensis TaxID=3390805 RepID=UPI003BF826B2